MGNRARIWIVGAALSVGLLAGCGGEDTSNWQAGTRLYAHVGKDGHVAYQGTIQSRNGDTVKVHNPDWGTAIRTYEDTADGLAAKGVYSEQSGGSGGTSWPIVLGALALIGSACWFGRRGLASTGRSSDSTAFDLDAVKAERARRGGGDPPSNWLPPGGK